MRLLNHAKGKKIMNFSKIHNLNKSIANRSGVHLCRIKLTVNKANHNYIALSLQQQETVDE